MAISFTKVEENRYGLDCQGYFCPHPQLYTRKAMKQLKTGDVLTVVVDNPSSVESIHSLCKKVGYKILESNNASGVFRISIEKTS